MISTHPINGRNHTVCSSVEEELTPGVGENGVYALDYLSILCVNGDLVHDFLQGLLTCDVREVNAHRMRPSALCNVQGRIIACLDLIEWHDKLYLIFPSDLTPHIMRRLTRAAQLSRVKLEAVDDYRMIGCYPHDTNAPLFDTPWPSSSCDLIASDDYACYRLNQRMLHAIVKKSFKPACPPMRGSLAWHTLRLQHGGFEIYPESSGLFLPHRLDLHQTPSLNFNKGCYLGQEIIARMQYRSKPKHGMQTFIAHTKELLAPGFKLSNNQNEWGEVVDSSPLNHNTSLFSASVLFDSPQHGVLQGPLGPVDYEPFACTH